MKKSLILCFFAILCCSCTKDCYFELKKSLRHLSEKTTKCPTDSRVIYGESQKTFFKKQFHFMKQNGCSCDSIRKVFLQEMLNMDVEYLKKREY